MTNRIRKGLLPFAIASLLAAPAAMAQNVTSSAITGVVLDAGGQPVPGATVTIVHEPSGTTRVVTTNASGRYNAQGMRVGGPYDVTVSKAGLAQAERDDVYLQLGQVSSINLSLQSSEQNAQELGAVTVSANALSQTFSPENKGTGTNISERDLDSMPTPGRDIQDVVRQDPRVVIVNRAEGKISAVGQNYRYNNITVDSVGANDPFGLNANGLPTKGTAISQDTIAEYNISTANYDVGNRRGLGANVNAVTKSGTNELHGSVYYVFQNHDWVGDFDGNDFNGYQRKWTGGATVGGPIVKDKLFFFLSYEKSKEIGAASSVGPEGSGATYTVEGLSADQVQAIKDAAAKYYGLEGMGNYVGGNSDLENKRYLAKIDWNINNDHRASLTWRRTKEAEPRVSAYNSSKLTLSSGWTMLNTDNKSYALHLYDDWTDNFSSTTTVSYAHFSRSGGPYNGVDMPAISIHPEHYYDPTLAFGTDYSYQANDIDTRTLYASWAGTWYLGDHTLKAGIDYERDKKYNLFLQNLFGSYEFDSLDDFINGDYYSYRYGRPADGLGLNDVAAAFTLKQWGVYLQDTWQVTDNLSLQYGVRLDIPKTDDKPIYNEDFAHAGFTTPDGKVLTSNQYTVDNKRIVQPRLSFNYQFDTERMMQLRGGAGLFITNPPAVWIGNIYSNAGPNVISDYCAPRFDGCDSGAGLPAFSADPHNQNYGTVSGAAAGQMTVNTVDPDFRLPSAWKMTLGYDAELPWWGLIATVDYEHIKQRNAIWYQDLNLGTPTGAAPDGRNFYYADPYVAARSNKQRANANSDYSDAIINLANTSKGKTDNLTLQLSKPFQNNWSARVGVTFSHTTDVNPGLSSVARSSYGQQYVTNPNENVASTSNFNTEMRVIAAVSWRHAFFGNYYTKISAFYDGHAGHPYSWAFGNDANGDGFTNDLVYIPNKGDVMLVDSNGAPVSAERAQQFYDYIQSNKYLRKHQGKIARRNGTRSPWLNQLDVSFAQEIPGLFAGNKGEIRLDIYNFLNLLDSDWGHERTADFPGVRNLADFYRINPDTGKYEYDISGPNYSDKDGNYAPKRLPYNTYPNDRSQRWGAQLTVRYTF